MGKTTTISSLHSSKPISYVTASLVLHGGLLAGLLIASANGLIPEGTQPLKEQVEISTIEVSKGQQITTIEPGPVSMPQEEKTQAAIVEQKPETQKAKKAAAKEESKEIATTLPPKEQTDIPPEEPVQAVAVVPAIEDSPVVVESESSNFEIQQIDADAKAFAAENKPELEKIESQPEPVVQQAAVAESEGAPAAVVIPEIIGEEKTAAPSSAAASATATQAAPPSTATNDLAFGVPSGTRSYLDLKQRPGNLPPQYPLPARRSGWQGRVLLHYYVTQAGTVEKIQILQSSGFRELDQEALKAISKYRFNPGQQGWTEHPVDFLLKGPAQQLPARLRTKEARNQE